MTFDASRRFTDREVAIVLRKASEIDDQAGSGAGGGLSLDDLREIAKEVGISTDAIDRAVGGLDHGRALGAGWAGAPLVRKSVHAVPGELSREAIARLMQVVDERTDSAGTISEALGSVRWTGSDRFRSSLVSVTPGDGETKIQVVEKAAPRMRRVFHLIPAAWAMMVGAPMIGAMTLGPAASVAAIAATVGAGVAMGRGVWTLMSAHSAKRVERLAAALSREAHGAAESGLLAPGVDPE